MRLEDRGFNNPFLIQRYHSPTLLEGRAFGPETELSSRWPPPAPGHPYSRGMAEARGNKAGDGACVGFWAYSRKTKCRWAFPHKEKTE